MNEKITAKLDEIGARNLAQFNQSDMKWRNDPATLTAALRRAMEELQETVMAIGYDNLNDYCSKTSSGEKFERDIERILGV